MLYDTHMHSINSDGRKSVDEMCEQAIMQNLKGIAFTDHADMNFYEERDTYNRIRQSIQDVHKAREKYAGQLEVYCGVELGEYLMAPKHAMDILQLTDYDVILCSEHFLPNTKWDKPYNRINFSEEGTDEELFEYLDMYFNLISETLDSYDFDVLAHLTCPVRYMTGLHERKTDVMSFKNQIRKILKKIIDKGIALELNTGGMNQRFHYCNVQNEDIFKMYKELGGELITLGSDAHDTTTIAVAFDQMKKLLKSLGFEHYHYYEKRMPQKVRL